MFVRRIRKIMGCLQSHEDSESESRGEERRSLLDDRDDHQPETPSERSVEGGGSSPGYSVPAGVNEVRPGKGAKAPGGRERELSNVVSDEMEKSRHGPIKTKRGREVVEELKKGYQWKEKFDHPSQEFLALMDRLFMECQLYLTPLSSQGDMESRREADAIVNEMVVLRNHWGPELLPNSVCNAFVRERILLTLGVEQRQFRIDCGQFFEPVPFYGNQQTNSPGELMKIYRFSVYNVARNEVILRYYLERSNVSQLYHVLCFTDDNCHGQVKPYGTEPPSYWEVRQNMLEDLNLRLSPETHQPPPPLAVTVFPTDKVYN